MHRKTQLLLALVAIIMLVLTITTFLVWSLVTNMRRDSLEMYATVTTLMIPISAGGSYLVCRRWANLYLDGVQKGISKIRSVPMTEKPATDPRQATPAPSDFDYAAPIRHQERKGGDLEL